MRTQAIGRGAASRRGIRGGADTIFPDRRPDDDESGSTAAAVPCCLLPIPAGRHLAPSTRTILGLVEKQPPAIGRRTLFQALQAITGEQIDGRPRKRPNDRGVGAAVPEVEANRTTVEGHKASCTERPVSQLMQHSQMFSRGLGAGSRRAAYPEDGIAQASNVRDHALRSPVIRDRSSDRAGGAGIQYPSAGTPGQQRVERGDVIDLIRRLPKADRVGEVEGDIAADQRRQ